MLHESIPKVETYTHSDARLELPPSTLLLLTPCLTLSTYDVCSHLCAHLYENVTTREGSVEMSARRRMAIHRYTRGKEATGMFASGRMCEDANVHERMPTKVSAARKREALRQLPSWREWLDLSSMREIENLGPERSRNQDDHQDKRTQGSSKA